MFFLVFSWMIRFELFFEYFVIDFGVILSVILLFWESLSILFFGILMVVVEEIF